MTLWEGRSFFRFTLRAPHNFVQFPTRIKSTFRNLNELLIAHKKLILRAKNEFVAEDDNDHNDD